MPEDWFAQNAPKAQPSQASGGDWFFDHSPKKGTSFVLPGYEKYIGAPPTPNSELRSNSILDPDERVYASHEKANDLRNLPTRAANIGKGAASQLLAIPDTVYRAAKAAVGNITGDPQSVAAVKGALDEIAADPWKATGIPDLWSRLTSGDSKKIDSAAADILAMKVGNKIVEKGVPIASKVAKGISEVPAKAGEKISPSRYSPKTVDIAGEKVPVLVGEANPTSSAGRKQISLKKSGVGSAKFNKFETSQHEAVKSAIRKTAQQTADFTGPMPEEPGAAMKSAADATFERAKPMYAALDDELITVPGDLHSAGVIVKKAITRAKALGYDFDLSKGNHYGEDPIGTGKPVSGNSHPLTDFMEIRSELGKMRRGSSDPAMRHRISEEMKQMTDAMNTALDNTGLKDTWKEADRLWAKGYALNSISDVLKSSTEGVESAIQPEGLEVIPSEVKGRGLEETLKDLSDDGTLARGLFPEEISNLRKSANILKRIQKTSAGTGYGESGSRSRAISHILRGAPGPIIGAGVGGGVGLMTGHPIAGLEAGGFAGFIVQSIGERALVNVMTKVGGVKALGELSVAKTPTEIRSAMKKVARIAAVTGAAAHQNDSDRITEPPEP